MLAYSTQFILNPFKGHTADERRITDEELAENIKEFALLDGAFVISGDGVVEAAGRYITVDTSAVQIPAGLGSRHASVAGISLVTGTIGIVVSQSGGLIKIFRRGRDRPDGLTLVIARAAARVTLFQRLSGRATLPPPAVAIHSPNAVRIVGRLLSWTAAGSSEREILVEKRTYKWLTPHLYWRDDDRE